VLTGLWAARGRTTVGAFAVAHYGETLGPGLARAPGERVGQARGVPGQSFGDLADEALKAEFVGVERERL
jgi:hypothetical protein